MVVQNCTFNSNTAEYNGHDIYLEHTRKLKIANCVLISTDVFNTSSICYCGDINSLSIISWNTTFLVGNATENLSNKFGPLKSGSIIETYFASGNIYFYLFYKLNRKVAGLRVTQCQKTEGIYKMLPLAPMYTSCLHVKKATNA